MSVAVVLLYNVELLSFEGCDDLTAVGACSIKISQIRNSRLKMVTGDRTS